VTSTIVAIGGPPGSGKSTAARLFADAYGFLLVSGGHLFRELAAGREMDLVAFGAYAQEHHDIDRQLDATLLAAVQEALVQSQDVVTDGRVQPYLLAQTEPKPFNVLITAPIEVRTKRIAEREGVTEELALEEILNREASERNRYQAIYGIDLDDTSVYALVIDSSKLPPESIVERIYEEAKEWFKT
jgi:cytidylate kinase